MNGTLKIKARDVAAALDIALVRLGGGAMIQSVATLEDGVEVTVIDAAPDLPRDEAEAGPPVPADLFARSRLLLAPAAGIDLGDAALAFGRELGRVRQSAVRILVREADCPRRLQDRAAGIGAEVVICEGMPLEPAPDRAELCLLPGHAGGAARAAALMARGEAQLMLVFPTGLRRARILAEAATWGALDPVAAFVTAPEAPAEPADRAALALAGLPFAGTVDTGRQRPAPPPIAPDPAERSMAR